MRIILTIVLVMFSTPSWACSCKVLSLADEYADSAAVFKAIVVAAEEFPDADSPRFWRTRLKVQSV